MALREMMASWMTEMEELDWAVPQLVECLSRIQEALGPFPHTTSTQNGRTELQPQHWRGQMEDLKVKVITDLGYMRARLKRKKKERTSPHQHPNSSAPCRQHVAHIIQKILSLRL